MSIYFDGMGIKNRLWFWQKSGRTRVDVKAMNSLAGGFHYLKKHLLKGADVEKADSKGLKTLALCWAFMKRAFSVSGVFRRMLSEMISADVKKRVHQTTLLGNVLGEEKFHIIGFVPISVLGLKEDNWLKKLDADQINCLEEYFSRPRRVGPILNFQRFDI